MAKSAKPVICICGKTFPSAASLGPHTIGCRQRQEWIATIVTDESFKSACEKKRTEVIAREFGLNLSFVYNFKRGIYLIYLRKYLKAISKVTVAKSPELNASANQILQAIEYMVSQNRFLGERVAQLEHENREKDKTIGQIRSNLEKVYALQIESEQTKQSMESTGVRKQQ